MLSNLKLKEKLVLSPEVVYNQFKDYARSTTRKAENIEILYFELFSNVQSLSESSF